MTDPGAARRATGVPSILILNDQYPFSASLPNLGDRALQSGFRSLCQALCRGDAASGPWKSFPYLTGARYRRSNAAAADVLAGWHAEVTGYSTRRTRAESKLARLLAGPLLRGGVWSPLDRWTQRRTGLRFFVALEPRILRAHAARRFRDRLAAADVVLFNAGGLLADHLHNYLPERLFQLYMAQRAGKPVAVVNYSLSLEEPGHVALAAPVLRDVVVHVVRDPISRQRLLALGVEDGRILVAPDAAFAIDPPPLPGTAPDSLEVGLMIRGDRSIDVAGWAALVECLRSQCGARVHYLQGCAKHDPPVRRALAARCRLDDDGAFLGREALLQALSRMSLLITDRYHGAVFAIQTHTAVIPVASTTHKTQGLFETFDYPVPVLSPLREALVPQYLHWAEVALRDRDLLSRQLAGIHRHLRERLVADYGELFRRLGVAEDQAGPS